MLKYMPNANIVIYVIKRHPAELLGTFSRHASQVSISAVTEAELMHGAEKSAYGTYLRQVEDFTSRLDVLEYGSKAAAHYGDIRADLERKGTPIGVDDLHIAAHARSEGLVLATNNTRELERV